MLPVVWRGVDHDTLDFVVDKGSSGQDGHLLEDLVQDIGVAILDRQGQLVDEPDSGEARLFLPQLWRRQALQLGGRVHHGVVVARVGQPVHGVGGRHLDQGRQSVAKETTV